MHKVPAVSQRICSVGQHRLGTRLLTELATLATTIFGGSRQGCEGDLYLLISRKRSKVDLKGILAAAIKQEVLPSHTERLQKQCVIALPMTVSPRCCCSSLPFKLKETQIRDPLDDARILLGGSAASSHSLKPIFVCCHSCAVGMV